MRQEKLSGLIHSSKQFPNLPSCSVYIHFCEIIDRDELTCQADGPLEVVAGSELVVGRTASRENKSHYTINGKTSSYTEVTTLLRQRGIDLDHKRFLILQGEVESIAQMKPKAQNEHEDGLLEYLEDIIGTSEYKQPIEDALKQMDQLNDERQERLNRVKLVEADVSALEQGKLEAESYLREENALVRVKNQLFQLRQFKTRIRHERANEETQKLKKELDELEKTLKSHLDEMNALQKQYQDRQSEYEELQSQAQKAQKEFAGFEREAIQFEEKKKHLKQKSKKLEKSLEKDKHAANESEVWLRNHEQDLAKKQKEVEMLQSNLAMAEHELAKIRDGLKGKTEKFQAELDKKKMEFVPWTEKMNEKRSEIEIKQSQLELLEQKTTQHERQLEEAQAKLEQEQSGFMEKKREAADAEQQLTSAQNVFAAKEADLQALRKQEKEAREAFIEASQHIESAKSAVQASQSRDALVNLLLNERDSGRIPGIFGRLSDLGHIDAKYDVAISSAYWEKMKWIVVDTVKTAEKCLKVLKAQNGGRASFIVMERTPSMPAELSRTPESAPRLVDLIQPNDAKFKKAFYYVVRDTLIATDLDQANRLAFGGKTRWRVVTLDGKVIDKAGTMSGGGNRIMKGAMPTSAATKSSKHAKNNVSAEEFGKEDLVHLSELKKLKEEELQVCRREIDVLERELEELKRQLPQLEETYRRLSMDVGASEAMIQGLQDQLAELGSQDGTVDQKDVQMIKKLQKEIKQLESEEEKLKDSTSGLQEEIQQLQNKILEVGGDQLRRQNSRVKDIEDQIATVYDTISRIESQKKTHEKATKKSQTHLQKVQSEIESIEQELAELESDSQSKLERCKKVRAVFDEVTALVNEKKADNEEVKKVVDEKMEFVNGIKRDKIELDNAYTDWKKRYKACDDELKRWTGLLAELKLTPLPEEGDATAAKQESEESDAMEVDGEDKSNVRTQELLKYTEEELEEMDMDKLEREMTVLQEKLSELKPNLSVLEEYKERYGEYLVKVKDLDAITEERDNAKQVYDDLRKRRLDEFMKGFSIISQKLKEMYQMITLGGNAELELVDSLDPFSEGIMFSVMPPKKSWKNISNLSGGEKTLSSLALVFALHHYKPTPLYVMDEIDAALDFRNVSIIANYIKERTKNAQFVIISLRNNMFELADRLVGIYKTDNCTKSVAINPNSVGIAAR